MNSKLKTALALGAVLALTAGIGVATGAIPSADGTITACQAKVGGVRYLHPIDTQAGESCKPSEKKIAWNQKGPKGDPGPQGPRGATGPAGAGSGPAKAQRRSIFLTVPAGATRQIKSLCKAGERVGTGGYFALTDGANIRVTESAPTVDLDGWIAEVTNANATPQDVGVVAVCES